MTKTSSNLQVLRRSLYVKAKAEPSWRFWKVIRPCLCKVDLCTKAYRMAKSDGAPGIDGVTFEEPSRKAEKRVFLKTSESGTN